MAKQPEPLKIKWEIRDDGFEPTAVPFGYVVRNPLIVKLPPGATTVIRTQVACSHPLHAWPTRTYAKNLKVAAIVQPGEEIAVEVTNTSQHLPLVIESKETLVNVCPIAPPAGTTAERG